jgi:hypothetical protein
MMRRPFIILLLVLIVHGAAWAQQEPLGRLFLTPQQRAALDRQRLLNPGFRPNVVESDVSQTLNGEVRRSNGRTTRWINGEARWNDTTPPPRVPVGDTFHPATGERESVLGSGRIIVRPGGSAK